MNRYSLFRIAIAELLILVLNATHAPAQSNNGEFSRAIVGFEQAGASAANSTQKFFFDLFVSIPFPSNSQHDDSDFGPRWRVWGNARVTSVPQQINSGIGIFVTNFPQQVAELKVNEVVQAAEFVAGVDCRILGMRTALYSFDRETKQKFSLSLIAGGGAITPITPRQSLEIFLVPSNNATFNTFYPQAMGKQFIAFVSSDRDRFFRQYYAGFRFKGFYFDANDDKPLKRFPANLDVTYGVNESVTGGRLHGGVLRLEGFYPLPFNRASWINLFGTAMLKPTRAKITPPLILALAPAGTLPTDPAAVVVAIPQINRDYYRIGVGIDFIRFAACFKQKPWCKQ